MRADGSGAAEARSRRAQRRAAAGPRKGDLREGQILDATENLLTRTPFADLTMDEISKRAGLSRSAMYFYFASKDQLLSALLARTHAELIAPLEAMTISAEPHEQAIQDTLELVIRTWRQHGPALRTFFETAMVSTEFGDYWRSMTQQHVDLMTQFIDRGRAAGTLPPGPPDSRAVASAMFWMLEHEAYELFRKRHTRAAEAELIATFTTIWRRVLLPW